MIGLTRRQTQALDFMISYRNEHRVMPTMQEISDAMGYGSKSRAYSLLECLEQRGAIRRMPGKARAYEIVELAGGQAVIIGPEIYSLIKAYAGSQRIGVDTAANELLRSVLGGDA